MAQALSQLLDAVVDQEADAPDGMAGHAADLLVAELLLEAEPQHLLLRRGEGAAGGQRAPRVITLFELRVWIGLRSFAGRRSGIVERLQRTLLLSHVERAVPADAEQPCRKVVTHVFHVFAAQAEEGVLDHVARGFHVTRDPRGEAD